MARGRTAATAAAEPVEGPWTLPEGWAWTPLESILTQLVSGRRPKGGISGIIEGVSSIGGEHIRWDGTVSLENERFIPVDFAASLGNARIRKDDILVVKDGATTGKTAYYPTDLEPTYVNEHVFIVRVDLARADPKFIFYWMWSRFGFEQIMLDFRGAAQGGIGRTMPNVVTVPLPPLGTQRQTVARIDELFTELDDGEATLARAKADLGLWRKALLKAAVTGELTADWRTANPPTETGADLLARILTERRIRWHAEPRNKGKRYVEPAGPEGDHLPALPAGWVWASLGQVASEQERSFQSGPFGSALLHSEFQAAGPLVIGIDNVREGYFSPGSSHRISEQKFNELRRFRARPDDVLVTVMATIGRTCVIPHDIEDAIITKHLYRITLANEISMPMFVCTSLRACPSTVNYMFGNTLGQTRPGLNKSILERTPIPVAPIGEQILAIQIAEKSLKGENGILDNLKEGAATLRQSILAAAFRGDLA